VVACAAGGTPCQIENQLVTDDTGNPTSDIGKDVYDFECKALP
jgi:hypothetical protein